MQIAVEVCLQLQEQFLFHFLLLQFYHEVQESEPWMLADFGRFSKAFDNQSSKPEKDDATKLAADLDVCSN